MARRPAPAAIVQAPVPTVRPTHIVLFKARRETNETVIANVLGVREAAGVRGMSSARTMLAPNQPRTMARMFDQLGVAAVVATPENVAALRADPDVEEVFPNEIRTIPPRPTRSGGGRVDAAPAMPGLEYLRGLRDGLDMALETFEGRRPRVPERSANGAGVRATVDESTLTWGLQALGISASYPLTGKGVKVAVLDTGVDLRHPDLAARFRDGANSRSFVPGVTTAQDGHGHGTHCIGTVGGPVSSRFGPRYGVAPDCVILAGKVLDDTGSGSDNDIVEGIQWAIDSGAQIVSMSLGSERSATTAFSRLYERIAERALEGAPGTLIVAAAGNESQRPFFTRPVGNPAACPSVMGVAALDSSRVVASFSCRTMDGIGRVDIAGPGVDILSSVPGGTGRNDGTSMATPHVAGVAALCFEADEGSTARSVWDRLISEARALGEPADLGAGLVQAPAPGRTGA